ncbi:hypothetical protein [Wolbachia endosymbiont of Pentidionis agamae]|uniref:hypothetical protein n=1 Tax=Wolbachia endosymbiont of Pentidionis agamae TaxID=3110435 RepID=UPI002FD5008B
MVLSSIELRSFIRKLVSLLDEVVIKEPNISTDDIDFIRKEVEKFKNRPEKYSEQIIDLEVYKSNRDS